MEEHVELLARHLNRERFEVFSICPEWQATEPFYSSLAHESDHIAKVTPDRRYGLRKLARETLRMYHYLRTWRIDVMHMHSTTFRGQIFALLAARLAGVKRVYVTEHLAPDYALPLAERVVRSVISRLVDGIVCVSKKNYEARAQYIYTPESRTLVVNNGVDLDDFPPIPDSTLASLRAKHQLPDDALLIGTVVRFEPEKGLNYLLDAMPAIRAACPNAYLLMVGDGSLRAELEAQAERLGFAEYVRFVGFQSDPRPYLGLIDVFVLPVPVGSMSIGLLEAMAMRRAVVITFGGEGEAVVHGESGFCATPRDPASIATYVTELLQDAELRERMGNAARQRIADTFSAQQVALALGKLYSSPR
ncbi:MAG TPA: glycosyltransferase family 4 protein [Kouleothrix sp.]|uniref:glycosyltransferase family 4 protein n=1 Tax=Kouleothrix sp. TaxID=2779161 RepID=UPI002D0F7222|nr:glycosyltransferase family 4 protein [Kouleothrix sp.]